MGIPFVCHVIPGLEPFRGVGGIIFLTAIIFIALGLAGETTYVLVVRNKASATLCQTLSRQGMAVECTTNLAVFLALGISRISTL